jgi:DNA-binding IclR family transcriptional regulator
LHTPKARRFRGGRGISAPIFDAGGLAVACLVLTIPMIRFLPGSREDLGALTRQRALAVAHVLGYEAAAASAATP